MNYDLNFGGLLTEFELNPSPADCKVPLPLPHGQLAAQLSIIVTQPFSFHEVSKLEWLCPYCRTCLRAVSTWDAEQTELCLNCLGRLARNNLVEKESQGSRRGSRPLVSAGATMYLTCCFADCSKLQIVLFEWLLCKADLVWLAL